MGQLDIVKQSIDKLADVNFQNEVKLFVKVFLILSNYVRFLIYYKPIEPQLEADCCTCHNQTKHSSRFMNLQKSLL